MQISGSKFKGLRYTATAALAFLCLATAQTIPRDEIHSQTVPYIPAPAVTLRTEVRIVEVPVVIRDEYLHAVAGLTRDDFEVYDNGKKQPITSFSVQSFTMPGDAGGTTPAALRPRFLALCFDDLHMLPPALEPVKDAAKQFVRTSLAPGDRVVVVKTSRSEEAQFTADVPALVEQIDKVTAFLPAVSVDTERCPAHINPYEAYRIAEHMDPGDEVLHEKLAECAGCYQFTCPEGLIFGTATAIWARTRMITTNSLGMIADLVQGMSKLPGQRVILLTSAGFLTGTLEAEVDRLMDQARRAEVVINGLDARGLYLNASAGMAYDGVGVLASGTGGTFFHNSNNMERGFRELGMLPSTSYLLGFIPSDAADEKFHKLKIRLATGKKYAVEARLGYTALRANADTSVSAASKLDSEVMASDTIANLPAAFTWEQWAGPPGITMIAHLDISRLHFKPWQDRRTQKLTIVAVLLDDHGSVITGKRSELQLSLKEATFDQLTKAGFTAALTLNAPPGNYRVRALAQDALDESKLAASSDSVQIK